MALAGDVLPVPEPVTCALATAERVRAAFARRGLPMPAAPYVAEARVETDGRTLDVLIGAHELVDSGAGVVLLDWRRSPLAAACLRHEPGEDYELDAGGGRRGHGRLLARAELGFRDGYVVRVVGVDGVHELTAAGTWITRAAEAAPPLLWPGDTDAGERAERVPMPLAAARFDERQQQALAHPAEPPLLISGGAGSGKTTVALHRVARLHRAETARFPRHKVQVVVSEPALAERTAEVLRELGLGQLDVATFDAWVARQAKRVLLDRPERTLEASPAAVVALKRHPALRAALPGFARALGQQLAARLDRKLAGRGQIVARWPTVAGASLLARLDALEAALGEESPENLRHEVTAAARRERSRLFRVRKDLLELFGDARLMTEVVAASRGELAPGFATQVVAHTRAQLRATSAERFAHVDEEAKQTLDHRDLDEGTPDELAASFDGEDDAVALELLRLKVGEPATRRGRLRQPALLLVDETQDLTAIELSLLGAARRDSGSLTISGDDAQQMATGAAFPGWDGVLAELGADGKHATHVALERNHRSRAPIVRFSAAVLGPLARAEEAAATGGADVLVTRVDDAASAALRIVRGVRELRARRPRASLAVLAARAETARHLRAVLPAGVTVATVIAAKGLEFDVVVVPDASSAEYDDSPEARRRLYVACSRAIEQLWVVGPGEPSPLLPQVSDISDRHAARDASSD